ncbi:glycosyltransferase [Pelagibacterium halotolerans]|uniref:Glycosyl transferase family protein n=1 Tax=Pelagibacterium halotolerans (strain DSM 22347 / JCM 15775 / CGMCC 1.7692 / B2) TaxID=1082931 RepID=G4RBU9_PELHB|nr:glycosyltransferase [Pelagibacterium halotolerans]AEQ50612.1 glycosyl transferase family protein [Pelagibacterium halotolerans B2]QJR19448.1 glycosyltransferase family 1 protein [Pelagibacterium halotolerans]SDZ91054.1 UDP:flavonoid glycosyltransferase YjiC, YdhE family [Pelagibacterium halotolerans]
MYRIAITTMGTRGDVQPYIALARGLVGQGHRVILLAPEQFDGLVAGYDIPFAPLPGDLLALLDTQEGKMAVGSSKGFGAGLKLLKHMRPLGERLLDAEWAAIRAFVPDLIVHHPKSFGTPHMAEALGCQYMLASPLPGFTPTSDFPTPLLPFDNLGPLNKVSHVLGTHAAGMLFRKLIGRFRRETLGLAGRRTANVRSLGTLYAYSPQVLPVPRDWGPDVLVSGYWFLDTPDWRPDPELAGFLAAGPAPIYIGFGSMPGVDSQEMTDLIVAALARTGKRGLIATGQGALDLVGGLPEVHAISAAPHDQLFRHVGATLHHGGAGTTGAALRAGKPTAICPFFGDQPFWARRIAELGAGPKALDRNSLSVEAVAGAIASMDNPDMRKRAAELGSAIGAEDGVAAAVAFIETRMAGVRPLQAVSR